MQLIENLLLVATCLSASSGFVVSPTFGHQPPPVILWSRERLREIDQQCIENTADFCLDRMACDVEEYEALINTLQDQRDIVSEDVRRIDGLLRRLRGHNNDLNKGAAAFPDEGAVRSLKQSIEHALEMEVSSGFIASPSLSHQTSPITVRSRDRLSKIDDQCIENTAEFCLDRAVCDVEEYEALINTLQDQRKFMLVDVLRIDGLLRRLRDRNYKLIEGAVSRDEDAVRSLMKSIEHVLEMEGLPSIKKRRRHLRKETFGLGKVIREGLVHLQHGCNVAKNMYITDQIAPETVHK